MTNPHTSTRSPGTPPGPHSGVGPSSSIFDSSVSLDLGSIPSCKVEVQCVKLFGTLQLIFVQTFEDVFSEASHLFHQDLIPYCIETLIVIILQMLNKPERP